MASISVTNKKNTSCEVYLSSLDTSWGGGTRTCKWYFKTGSYPTESSYTKKVTSYISGSPSSGGNTTVSGLTANTTYYCSCYIYDGSSLLATIKGTFKTHPTVSITSFSVSQTAVGTKRATVSWSGSNISGGYYYIYANGWLKAEGSITSNTMSKTISFDDFGTFTIELEGDHYGQNFYKSKNVTIRDYDLTPTYDGVTRGYRSLRFDWSGAADADGFIVTLDYWGGNWDEVGTSLYYKTFTNLDFGTTYYIYVQAYSGSKYGNVEFGFGATTLPAPPTISLSQNGGYITVNYGVTYETNVDSFTFYLLNSSGQQLETKTINVTDGNQNPDGNFKFSKYCSEGTYTVRAVTTFMGLNSVTSSGAQYTTKTITVNLRPDDWYWSGVTKGTRVDNISYTQWNEFIDKIQEWLDYKEIAGSSPGTSAYGSATTMTNLLALAKINSTATGKILTANRFNIARYCINCMNTTGLADKIPGDIVFADYFTTLAEKMNNISSN